MNALIPALAAEYIGIQNPNLAEIMASLKEYDTYGKYVT